MSVVVGHRKWRRPQSRSTRSGPPSRRSSGRRQSRHSSRRCFLSVSPTKRALALPRSFPNPAAVFCLFCSRRRLFSRRYNPELTAQWTREISDEIKNRLKNDLELPRYKFVVQVVVGEQRGEGVRMGCRCFWDADTDNYAEESFKNVRQPARNRTRAAPNPATCTHPRVPPRTARSPVWSCRPHTHIHTPADARPPLPQTRARACRTRCFASRRCLVRTHTEQARVAAMSRGAAGCCEVQVAPPAPCPFGVRRCAAPPASVSRGGNKSPSCVAMRVRRDRA